MDTPEQENERLEVLQQLDEWLDTPLIVLGFVWLALLLVEFIWGSSPLFETLGFAIWAIFIVDFVVRFALAPRKGRYLRRNLLTAVSLLLPALRIFRAVRVVRLLRLSRATRGLRLVRVVASVNRGMNALAATMSRRGFGYVLALTLLVTLAGGAGMYAFEGNSADTGGFNNVGFNNYGEALWWTAMLLTSLGSEYWPQTTEGRILCLLIALYGFTVFGYLTATLASFFIGRDAANGEAEVAGSEDIRALRLELAGLREDLQRAGEA